jgi:hypothetical protein
MRPAGRIFDDKEANTGEQAAGVNEGAEPPVLRYGVVNNYRTNFDDFLEVYLFGIQLEQV